MASDLTSEMVGRMERPTPGVADEERRDVAREDQELAALRDKHGRPFDPEMHVTDDKGKPRLTREGRLSIRPGRGTKPGTPPPTAQARSIVPPAVDQIKATAGAPAADYRGVAVLTVANIVSLCTILMGKQWQAPDPEVEAMCQAWEAYYRKKGISEVSPEAMLALAMSGYALPRMIHEDTRSRVKRAGGRMRAWFKKRRPKPAPEDPDARPDPGPNGVG